MHTLARTYRQYGGEATLVVGDAPTSLIDKIERDSIRVFRVLSPAGQHADAIATREIIALERPHWLAIDGPRFSADYHNHLADGVALRLAMNGPMDMRSDQFDLAVQPLAQNDATIPWENERQLLVGPQFSLVDTPADQTKRSKRPNRIAKKILVAIAGPDQANWTLRTLQALSDLDSHKLSIDCIVSPNYAHFSELESFKQHSAKSFRLHKNTDRLLPIVDRADLAIAQADSASFTLAQRGMPTILVTNCDDQDATAQLLHNAGAMHCVSHQTKALASQTSNLRLAIKQLINNSERRQAMAKSCQQLIDGLGAKRIISRMTGVMLQLRAATIEDAAWLYRWRNDPEVRSVAFDSASIPWPDHESWLQKHLGDPRHQILISENAYGAPIGSVQISLDRFSNEAMINVIVDQRQRGRGLDAALINAAVDYLFATTSTQRVIAKTRAGNIAGERSFRLAGFTAIAPTIVRNVMASQFELTRKAVSKISNLHRAA